MALEPSLRERLRLYHELARIADDELDLSWSQGMDNLLAKRKRDQIDRGLKAKGKTPDWSKRITAAIRANPNATDSVIAKLVGCGKVTIQRYRKKV